MKKKDPKYFIESKFIKNVWNLRDVEVNTKKVWRSQVKF